MTPSPQTLLHLAGVPAQPGPLAESALMLIDHQTEYLPDGGLPLVGMAAAVRAVQTLLTLARRHGVPVFHVVHHGRPGGALFDPAGSGVRIIPGLAPDAGEAVVVKSLPNGFAHTDLAERLRQTGRSHLIFAGFATHMCVSSTVRAALDHGYRTTVVADAVATRDLPDPLGGAPLPAAAVQRAALAALADRFATIVADSTVWR
jgi:nicotinamidase-related amidase